MLNLFIHKSFLLQLLLILNFQLLKPILDFPLCLFHLPITCQFTLLDHLRLSQSIRTQNATIPINLYFANSQFLGNGTAVLRPRPTENIQNVGLGIVASALGQGSDRSEDGLVGYAQESESDRVDADGR